MNRRLKFETDKGAITIGKGCDIVFSTFDPNEGSTEYQRAEYVDVDGSEILDGLYNSRELTIEGTIVCDSEISMTKVRREMIKIMNGKDKGVLTYYDGRHTYYADCLCELPKFDKPIRTACGFSVTFILYNFYWMDKENTINVFRRTKKIKSSFTFPMAFSTRENLSTIINNGDVDTPIKFEIKAKKVNNDSYLGHGMKIKKNDTEFLEIIYDMADNEVLTINTKEKTIVSNIKGNMLHKLTEDSVFFKLNQGENVIEIINNDNTLEIVANATYRHQFVGV